MKPKVRRIDLPTLGTVYQCSDGIATGSGKTVQAAYHAWQRWRAMKFRDDATSPQQPLQPANNRA